MDAAKKELTMRMRCGLILLFALILVSGGIAQVQVTAPDTLADNDTEIAFPIRISNCSAYDVYSYQFTMTYNSEVVTPVGLQTTNTLTSGWPTPVMNDSTAGVLEIGGYGYSKISGGGTLVKILFDVIGDPDETTNLNFTYFIFNDGSPTASTDNGSVTVTSSAIPVTITTNVLAGTQVIVDGTSYAAPHTAYWEIGTQHQISAASLQTIGSDKRYIYHSWSDGGAQTHTVTASQPTTITATYSTQYYLTVQSNYGTPQGSGWYDAGASAYFSVEAEVQSGDDSRHSFTSWTGSGTGGYSGSVREANATMNGPITETANWSTQHYLEVTSLYGTPFGTGWYNAGTVVSFGIDSTTINRWNAHYQFDSWTGTGNVSYSGPSAISTVTVNGPITEQADWNVEFLVETSSSPEGLLDVSGDGWYQKGYSFSTIKAPDTLTKDGKTYEFKGWKVNDQVVSGNPATIAINQPSTIIADYNQDITVVITTNIGAGTKVLVDGEEKSAPHTAAWNAGTSHSIGVVTTQNGIPGTRFTFKEWQHGGEQVQTVSPNANINYTADLSAEYYLEVTSDPEGVYALNSEGWYDENEVVVLDTVQSSFKQGTTSYRFIEWQEDGEGKTGNPVSIVMDEPHTAVAKFQQGYYLSGTITFVGSGPAPVTINVSGAENFNLTTNGDGSYLIGGLKTDNYQIMLYHPNYRFEPPTRSYQVTKNEEYQYYVAFYLASGVENSRPSGAIPENFNLSQNYPNPFSFHTNIDYQLKSVENVTLTIYNIRGQLVNRLVNRQQPGGFYRIQWNRTDFSGTAVPAGVYFYRIEAGDFKDMKPMVIF